MKENIEQTSNNEPNKSGVNEDLQAMAEEIINKYFEITKIRITHDDPTFGMLLVQRIDLKNHMTRLNEHIDEVCKKIDSHVKKHNKSLEGIFDDVENKTLERFTEVDIRFKQALDLSVELKNQRERLLTELSVLHQKNIIDFAKETNEKLESTLRQAKYAFFTAIGATVSSITGLYLLINLFSR
jgi:hypothetical protein